MLAAAASSVSSVASTPPAGKQIRHENEDGIAVFYYLNCIPTSDLIGGARSMLQHCSQQFTIGIIRASALEQEGEEDEKEGEKEEEVEGEEEEEEVEE